MGFSKKIHWLGEGYYLPDIHLWLGQQIHFLNKADLLPYVNNALEADFCEKFKAGQNF